MNVQLSTICLASFLLPLLTAAEPAKPPALTPNQIDAQTIFAHQAGTVPLPTGDAPAVVGAYLWGGRADINYRSFFQWELRLAAGEHPLQAPRLRIITLGPSRQALASGPWQQLPDLPAHGSSDISYRQSCPIFPAYQVELAWSDGQETFLAGDKGAVPVALSPLQSQGYVMAVNLAYEPDRDHPGAIDLTWSDWNVGGKPARGIVHTLHLYNAAGKDFRDLAFPAPAPVAGKASRPGTPAAGSTPAVAETVLAAAGVAERHWHLAAPAFATVSMSVEQADEGGTLETQGFGTGKEVDIAFVHADGKLLKAQVRNGLPTAQEGLSVSITLQDAKGADLATVQIPVGHLDPGAVASVSAPLPAGVVFAGFASTWTAADAGAGASASAPPAAVAGGPGAAPAAGDLLALGTQLPVAHARGLSFTPTGIDHTPCGLLIHGVLRNRSGREIDDVRLRIAAADGEERSVLRWKTARCRDQGEEAIALACPLEHLSALALDAEGWR